jgi:hypothetical protein
LARNAIFDAGAKAIADALKLNKTLTHISIYNYIGLNYNTINAEGAKAISAALKENKSLIKISKKL